MCGICGYISKKVIDKDTLQEMNDTMIRRGPDDYGVELYDDGDGFTVGMAQRRLAIMDLSPLGHQPMHSGDGRITLVYNGEIYNFQELKKELSDYPFTSTCDTEVILAAYLKWGMKEAAIRFNGMFAIALYDRATHELFLVRDRVGVKPLYYWVDAKQGPGLVFASELKPFMAYHDFPRRIRTDVLPRFLAQQYINAPETIFEDVYKLEPGSILTYQRGRISTEKYWDVNEMYHKMQENPVTDYAQAKSELKDLLRGAVGRRLIADVPFGSFLSGGYDSSLVSAIAQECLGDTPLRTFAIGFNEESYNEAEYAKQVARHLGTSHTELYIGEEDMLGLVDSIAEHFDEPMADSSQIPTMLVSKLAKQSVTVVLSGDAGDEFFCGYNVYDYIKKAQQLDPLGAAAHALGQLPVGGGKHLFDRYPIRVRAIAGNRDPQTKTQFTGKSYAERAARMVRQEGDILPLNYPMEEKYGVDNWQVRRMLLDMETYLPGDILAKVDRASMKYSLETRCPILDKDVMEYSYRIDHSFKYHEGSKKHILKDIAYDYIPRELLERPKKGFSVPLGKWLQGPLREKLEYYADPALLRAQGLFDADYVSGMVKEFLETGDGGRGTGRNFSKLSWSFYVFQQWYEKYVK